MSTTSAGYVIDSSDDGIAIIPAPPSEEMDGISSNQHSSTTSYRDFDSTMTGVSSACPSRDSVSAAIALVRAKQAAKSAIMRAEEQILQPRSFSSEHTATSLVSDSSAKGKISNNSSWVENENENAVPVISLLRDKTTAVTKASTSSFASGHSKVQSSENIGFPPPKEHILSANNSEDSGPEETVVDAKTIEDVNAFLTRLGVGALHTASNESFARSEDSFEKMRLMSSGSIGVSFDEKDVAETEEPEKEKSIEAKEIGSYAREDDEAQNRISRPSPIYEFLGGRTADSRDPPSTSAPDIPKEKADPPGPSHMPEDATPTAQSKRENPFLALSFSQESLENSPPPTPAISAVEDEKRIDESTDDNIGEKEFDSPFVDKSYKEDVGNVLSTVDEATPMEADDNNGVDEDVNNDNHEMSIAPTIAAVASEEQESVYGADGKKEPKGFYEKAKVEVEKIPVSNIGVEQIITNNMSVMSMDSHQVGNERHSSRVEEKGRSKTSKNIEADDGSLPWALRDVASEETMRATGRRRPRFVVSGPRPSNKSRNSASLFDDTSQQASETTSALHNDISYDSDEKSDEGGGSNDNEENKKTETQDLPEAEGCVVDTLLYNTFEPEDDYALLRGSVSSDVIEAPVNDKARREDTITEDQPRLTAQDLSVFVATIDQQLPAAADADQNEDQKRFKALISSIIEGHKPSSVESATIRESAKKAKISLDVVDQFLAHAANKDSNVWDSHQKDDDTIVNEGDVEAFSNRVAVAAMAKARKEISAAASEIEAAWTAEEEAATAPEEKAAKNLSSASGKKEATMTNKEKAKSSATIGKEQSNSFLSQFEDLDFEDDLKSDSSSVDDHLRLAESQGTSTDEVVDVISPIKLVNYFSTIHHRKFERENDEKLLKDFKKLMTPVLNGQKPTIIEEAQIRQAALKADVPLEFVDAYIDYVKNDNPEITRQSSKESQKSKQDEPDFLQKGWEDIEDLDEDDAIAAFLSDKFGVKDLKAMNKKLDRESVRGKALREKKAKELLEAGSRDYDIEKDSMASLEEPDFNRSKESECRSDEEDLNYEFKVESMTEPDFNRSEDSEPEASENISEEESVSSHNIFEDDAIGMEMLTACKSIEGYDEDVWQRRSAMATYGWGWEEATWLSPKNSKPIAKLSGAGIDGVVGSRVASDSMFHKKAFPIARMNCKLSYNRRVKSHEGYFDVDVYSLQESATHGEKNVHKDETPWELRYVRQRFLYERSLTFSRNWFGDLVKTSGNDKIKAPICQPKSMEMPMRKIPDPGDWTPEWYTTWGGQKLLLPPTVDSCTDDSDTETRYTNDKDSLRSYYSSGSSYDDDDDEEWEDFPECGNIINTRLKIGEHVSRVHPDYTSSLRKSRWRKKYFPIGTFPY